MTEKMVEESYDTTRVFRGSWKVAENRHNPEHLIYFLTRSYGGVCVFDRGCLKVWHSVTFDEHWKVRGDVQVEVTIVETTNPQA